MILGSGVLHFLPGWLAIMGYLAAWVLARWALAQPVNAKATLQAHDPTPDQAAGRRRAGLRWSSLAAGAAWALHGGAIVGDLLTPPPHFGFAPALSVTAWLVMGIYALENWLDARFPFMEALHRGLSLPVAACLGLTLAFPGENLPHVHSAWLPLHWGLGIASYGLLALAVAHAALLGSADRRLRTPNALSAQRAAEGANESVWGGGLPVMTLERLTFRFVWGGFVVLTLALVLGMLATLGSERGWRWDHKTVFSLFAWGVLAVLVGGRSLMGWRGKLARAWLYSAAALLLLAYVGSRFVVEAVLQRGSPA
jgi:ABC-type uncharacterized transport system permease subunit